MGKKRFFGKKNWELHFDQPENVQKLFSALAYGDRCSARIIIGVKDDTDEDSEPILHKEPLLFNVLSVKPTDGKKAEVLMEIQTRGVMPAGLCHSRCVLRLCPESMLASMPPDMVDERHG